MAVTRVIRGWDEACQPTIRTITEALKQLESLCDLKSGRCWMHVPKVSGRPAHFAHLYFSAANGDQVRVDFPMAQRCRAQSAPGVPRYLSLEAFNQAEVDLLGHVFLRDGTTVQAVNFDTVRFPVWTDLEEAIIWLTICAFGAEHIFLRRHGHVVGIDYSILHTMREPNVKALARYINGHIGNLPRASGKPPIEFVSVASIQRTLNIVGIGKVRGRKRRLAA